MSQTIWGIMFQGFDIINNLISWNLIPPRFILNFSFILGGLNTSHKGDFILHVLGSNSFLYNIREPKYKPNIMKHPISRHEIVQYLKFRFWYPIFIFLFLGFLMSYRNLFVHQTELWIPPFKWNMSQPSILFVTGDTIQTILDAFFLGHPVYFFHHIKFYFRFRQLIASSL